MNKRINSLLKLTKNNDIKWYSGAYGSYYAVRNNAELTIDSLSLGDNKDVFYLYIRKDGNYGFSFGVGDKGYNALKELYALVKIKHKKKTKDENLEYACKIIDEILGQNEKKEKT